MYIFRRVLTSGTRCDQSHNFTCYFILFNAKITVGGSLGPNPKIILPFPKIQGLGPFPKILGQIPRSSNAGHGLDTATYRSAGSERLEASITRAAVSRVRKNVLSVCDQNNLIDI